MALSNDAIRILAQTVMGEARGEGYDGMRAIAHVIRNRAESGRYPSDPVAVALQDKQFSAWNDGPGGNNPGRFGPGSPGYDAAVRAVRAAFSNSDPDPTRGATHYWAPQGMDEGADPYWASSEQTRHGRIRLGNHVFLPRQPVGRTQVAALDAINTAAPPTPPQRPASLSAYNGAPVLQKAVVAPPTPPQRPDTLVEYLQAPTPPRRPAYLGRGLNEAFPTGPASATPQLTAWNEAGGTYEGTNPLAKTVRGYTNYLTTGPQGPSTRQARGAGRPLPPKPPAGLQRPIRSPTPPAPPLGLQTRAPIPPAPPTGLQRPVTPPPMPIPRPQRGISDPVPFPFPSNVPQDRALQVAMAEQGLEPYRGAPVPPQPIPRPVQVASTPPIPPQRPPSVMEPPFPIPRPDHLTPPPVATYASETTEPGLFGQIWDGIGNFRDNGGLIGMGMNLIAGKGFLPGDEGVLPQYRREMADAVEKHGWDRAIFSRPMQSPVFSPDPRGKGATAVTAINRAGNAQGFLSATDRGRDKQRRGYNKDIYRANRAAVGGALTQENINRALREGKTLYRLRG